jgi:hypothetical protein
MTVSNTVAWPYRSALILTATALLLAGLSLIFSGSVGTACAVGALAVVVLAGFRFAQAWRHQG